MGAAFTSRITKSPRAFDARRGDDAAAALGLAPGNVADLINGAAGSSPYLCGLITRESEWLTEALDQSPEDAFDALLTPYDGVACLPDPSRNLRQMKRRAALLVGLADLGGVWCAGGGHRLRSAALQITPSTMPLHKRSLVSELARSAAKPQPKRA